MCADDSSAFKALLDSERKESARMREFCLEYIHGGQRWALNFHARDADDARDKLESIRRTLVIVGELDSVIAA